uniref:Uncharacterized protein n=1 Tax=Arundo donax TaxID=35708 RepID=A0A0A9C0S3_ARUDO
MSPSLSLLPLPLVLVLSPTTMTACSVY